MAGIAAAAGAALLLASVPRAAQTGASGPMTAPTAAVPDIPSAPVGSRRPALPGEPALAAATERNPFHPERRRGGVFSVAGGAIGEAIQDNVADPEPEVTAFLSGTALTGGGRDFVLCRAGHADTRIVRIGGRCGALELVEVERMRAIFRDEAGDDVVLELPKAGGP